MFFHDLAWTDTGLETKAVKDRDDVALFTGIATTADRDLTDDVIEPGAFGNIVPKNVRMFRDHMREHLIGGWKKFEQQGKELHVEGEICLSPDVPKGRETYALMKQGFLNGLSVGFRLGPGGAVWDEKKQIRIIKKALLLECSIVALPANRGAKVVSVKGLSSDDTRQWLRDNGMADDEIEVVMRKGFDALRQSRRLDISEIDGFKASNGGDSGDERLTALASQLKALLHDVRERRSP